MCSTVTEAEMLYHVTSYSYLQQISERKVEKHRSKAKLTLCDQRASLLYHELLFSLKLQQIDRRKKQEIT